MQIILVILAGFLTAALGFVAMSFVETLPQTLLVVFIAFIAFEFSLVLIKKGFNND